MFLLLAHSAPVFQFVFASDYNSVFHLSSQVA